MLAQMLQHKIAVSGNRSAHRDGHQDLTLAKGGSGRAKRVLRREAGVSDALEPIMIVYRVCRCRAQQEWFSRAGTGLKRSEESLRHHYYLWAKRCRVLRQQMRLVESA